jgi:hypothetical protein
MKKIIYENLKTFFVDIDKFLYFLKKKEFTGEIYFTFPDKECALFLIEGDIVGGVAETNSGERKTGQEAVKAILSLAKTNPEGDIKVYTSSLETVNLLRNIFSYPVKTVYKNLAGDFIYLSTLIAKLKREFFTGYIEIIFKNKRKGFIIFEKGSIKAVITTKNKVNIDIKEETIIELVPSGLEIIEPTHLKEAQFNIFQAI